MAGGKRKVKNADLSGDEKVFHSVPLSVLIFAPCSVHPYQMGDLKGVKIDTLVIVF